MIARGFKPVGWVAAVAGAALGCYMLSLNVAAERAELAKLEWKIVMAKRDIRSLQTELGTRGRLQQLENWNANVLALSAPTSSQFLDNELTLARFDQREKTFEESGKVQLASAEAPQPRSVPQPVQQAQQQAVQQPRVVLAKFEPAAEAPARESQSLVHRASYSLPQAKPVVIEKKVTAEKKDVEKKAAAEPKKAAKPQQLAEAKPVAPAKAAAKKPLMLDDKLIKDISEAAKSEKAGSAGGR
jgi:hypothetical protein